MQVIYTKEELIHTRPRKDVESYQESTIGLDLPLNMEFISRLTLLDSYKG